MKKKNSLWIKFFCSALALSLSASLPLSAQVEDLTNAAQVDIQANTDGGQKITMDLKGVEILDVLKILSKRTGLNIVAGSTVQGVVTLYLQNIDIWDALTQILQTANLAYIKENDIVRVITAQEYEKMFGKSFYDFRKLQVFNLRYAKAAEIGELINQIKTSLGQVIIDDRTNNIIIQDTQSTLTAAGKLIAEMDVPTRTKVYTLRYANVDDLEPKIRPMINPATGSLEIDARSNKIYISDVPSRVNQIDQVIKEFDSQPQQVLIEAKVIEVTLNDQTRFGIDWNLLVEREDDSPYRIGSPLTTTLPTSGPLSGTTLVTLMGGQQGANGDDFNFILSALEGVGKTNVLSSPRLTVLNNQEAKLAVATRQPYVSQTVIQGDATATTADNVQFVDVGVTLTVKPTISQDDFVIMTIKPAVSSAGTPLQLQGVSAGSDTTFVRTIVPVITTQEVETTVIVRSGTTIIMGGLIQDQMTKTFSKIPVLGDIPFFGAAFRNQREDFSKTELVLFLTPRILNPAANTPETQRFFEEDGELQDFDKVGDVDFVEAYRNSVQPVNRRNRPYWDDRVKAGEETGSSLEEETTAAVENWENNVSEKTVSASPAAAEESVQAQENLFPDLPTVQPQEPAASEMVSAAEAAPAEEPAPAPAPNLRTSLIPEQQSQDIMTSTGQAAENGAKVTWRSYFQSLKSAITQTLKEHPETQGLQGDVRLEFIINNNGQMQDLKVLNTRQIQSDAQKQQIASALQQKSNYTPLPQEFGAAKKIHLTVRL